MHFNVDTYVNCNALGTITAKQNEMNGKLLEEVIEERDLGVNICRI